MLVSFRYAPGEAGLINILILACSFKLKRYNRNALCLQVVLIPVGARFTLKAARRHIFSSACWLTLAVGVFTRLSEQSPTRSFLQQLSDVPYPTLVPSTHTSCQHPVPRRASITPGRSHSDLELDPVFHSIQNALTVFLL